MPFDSPADAPADTSSVDRRQFLTWSAGGAFLLASTSEAAAQDGAVPTPVRRTNSPWFRVEANGRLTVLSNAVEMGQGTHTGHAAILADELDMPWDMVDVEMVDLGAYSNSISTGGSNSIRNSFANARTAGAQARAQFAAAAAKRWNVEPSAVNVIDGKVVNAASNASFTFGQLAVDAANTAAPAGVAPKDAKARRYIGKDVATKKAALKSNGTIQYGMDVRLPGMVRAAVIQSPQFGGTLASVDEAPAMAVPGVKKVIKLDNVIAVLATDTWTAIKASKLLKPVWTPPANRGDTVVYRKALADSCAAAVAAPPSAQAATLRQTFSDAAKKVEQSYDLSHLAHVTMEPQNCTAQVTKDKIEIWGPTQVPNQVINGAVRAAGAAAGTPVTLHTTMLGGGFGRRLNTDYLLQAVRIAAQADGVPVQMVWTREEDFTHDVYRVAVRQTYRGALNAQGLVDGYECIGAATDSSVRGGTGAAPYSAIRTAVLTQAQQVRAGIPFGYWRSVDEGMSTFGRESFIDECAIAAGQDPYEYRLKLLGDNERVKRLLTTVADKIGWKTKRPAGTGVGIAVGAGFGSFTAHAVEVELKGTALKVKRIVVASDLGTVVAPAQVRAQFEGGSLMALGTALHEGMTFTDGKANETNFHQYSILRFKTAPKVEVFLFDTPGAAVGGSGEPPVPTMMPALTNAIAAAGGKRVRALPVLKNAGYTLA